DVDRESTSPAGQPRQFPAANQAIQKASAPGAERLALAKGQVNNPVRVQLMSVVEIRNTALQSRVPSIDNPTQAASEAAVGRYSLGIRGEPNRLKKCVVKVKLPPMQ